MDLMDTKNKKTAEFSLGIKQRLGIALAMLNDPELLVLDEPTNGLNPFGMEDLRKMIRTFAVSGISVIISSHILNKVQQVADDIGIIYNGSLLYQEKIDANENLEQLFMDILSFTAHIPAVITSIPLALHLGYGLRPIKISVKKSG